MKKNYRRLTALLKMIPAEKFFSVNLGNYDVNLLAYYSPQIVIEVLNHKFNVVEEEDGHFLKFRRGNVYILITEK